MQNTEPHDEWLPFQMAFDLPDETMIVAIYADWTGGEILTKQAGSFQDLSGEPCSMLPDLEQFQVIGRDRNQITRELLA